MSARPEVPTSSTNSIEIFIDADGRVTFTDLPEELRQVAQSLSHYRPVSADWCSLKPQHPKPADQDSLRAT